MRAPAGLSPDARGVWRQLAPQLHRCGLLTTLDVSMLEILVIHMGRHRQLSHELTELDAQIEGPSADTPLLASGVVKDAARLSRALRAEAEIVRSLASGFGLTPADRTRVHVPPVEAPSKWEGMFGPEAVRARRQGLK